MTQNSEHNMPQDGLPELLRGDREPTDAERDAGSEELMERVASLRSVFAPPEEVEPPFRLADRTLERLLQPPASETPTTVTAAEEPDRFRSSLEIATGVPRVSDRRLTRGRLVIRAFTQVAAACLLFAACGLFWNVYLPAYAEAQEERIHQECRGRLLKLYKAARRFQSEQPNAEALLGVELRRRLIKFGYADATDFRCPALEARHLHEIHFSGYLPPAGDNRRVPIFWDKFNNHTNQINVVFSDGTRTTVSGHRLAEFLLDFLGHRKGSEEPR